MESVAAEYTQASTICSGDVDCHPESTVLTNSNKEDTEPKNNFSSEEARGIMEVIAATGKFWHDWDVLKNVLSFRLKQVLAEYPESKMVGGAGLHKSSLSGETYPELVKTVDEELLSFMDGPPFTLQRLCEILLNPKSTYKSLPKLALALEKNLLVTSTLSICTEPYPTGLMQKPSVTDIKTEELQSRSSPVPNGAETLPSDADEEMVEAEACEDATNSDAEMQEDNGRPTAEEISEPKTASEPSENTA